MEDIFLKGLLMCPICKEKKLEIGECEDFKEYISFQTYTGKSYEAVCLSCNVTGEGKTVKETIEKIKFTPMGCNK